MLVKYIAFIGSQNGTNKIVFDNTFSFASKLKANVPKFMMRRQL